MSRAIDRANALRMLAIDAVQQACSGHPGMPMGMADIAEVLWGEFLRHNPANPAWINRDRFVLSNGHGCMLLYALLHLTGYELSIDDIKQFRQLHSKTPGHPEYGHTPGVETTTGPLGQGLANAVGMALAERTLAAEFNTALHEPIDHFTYAFVGDGCLMEGISHEVCSLAGTLRLGKLIVFYDDNGISIDGKTQGWFTDDTPKRFEAYNWQVIPAVNGHDSNAIRHAIIAARDNKHQPTLICCKTEIGHGSPNLAGSEKTHGAPLGDEEIAATRQALHWPYPPFVIPDDIKQDWDARAQGQLAETAWQNAWDAYAAAHPEPALSLQRRLSGTLPDHFTATMSHAITQLMTDKTPVSTRKASGNYLNTLSPLLPELFGGSADLTGSNCTRWKTATLVTTTTPAGNYLEYGVREFGMFAIMNGLALHGGFIPFGGTFLVFADYGRNAIRLAALMRQCVIFVLTHDSIGLGEDGPTHQPIEHAAMLRNTPHLRVWRPADSVETAIAWTSALTHAGPSCLLLSRQDLPALPHQEPNAAERGAYIIADCDTVPDAILIATGSEVHLALAAAHKLTEQGRAIRVVSIPCAELFSEQPADYREKILPAAITARVAIEAASKNYWYQYVGLNGTVIGLDDYGAAAPADALYHYFGITLEHIVNAVNALTDSSENAPALSTSPSASPATFSSASSPHSWSNTSLTEAGILSLDK